MSEEERTEWLKSLKPGDEVAYTTSNYGTYKITKIIKITPKGKIKIENGTLYSETGYHRGFQRWDFGSHIYPVTDEIKNKIKRNEYLFTLQGFKFEKLNTSAMEKIIEIINEDLGLKTEE